jgi:hypothetical protein
MESIIKDLRIRLDGITQLTQDIDKSREISLSITSLQLSKMWLGKVLKELGTANPYPDSKNPANEKIEPTADKIFDKQFPKIVYYKNEYKIATLEDKETQEMSHIQKVKWLRAEIEKVEDRLKELFSDISKSTYEEESFKYSIQYCIEAGLWLGMELGRIRDLEQINKQN